MPWHVKPHAKHNKTKATDADSKHRDRSCGFSDQSYVPTDRLGATMGQASVREIGTTLVDVIRADIEKLSTGSAV